MHKFLKTIRISVLVLNCISILLLWLCCASTWLHPESFPRLAVLGLLFPVFLVAELIFIPIWLCVNYRMAWIPLAALLPIFGFILDYCPLSLNHDIPPHAIKIMTWNTYHFGSQSGAKDEAEKKQTIEYILNSDADIICLQESTPGGALIDSFYTEMELRGYKRDVYRGATMFTRFDILSMDTVDYETTEIEGIKSNGSKSYILKVDGKELLLVNNHLESNHLGESEKQEYVAGLDNPEYADLKESGRLISRKLTASVAIRGPQADSLAALAQRNEGKYIVMCGDFNDTPISYPYQRLNRELASAFRKSGNGIGLSYNKKGFWVRIDHLFHSSNCTSYHTHIDNSIATSDHYPLISWLVFE